MTEGEPRFIDLEAPLTDAPLLTFPDPAAAPLRDLETHMPFVRRHVGPGISQTEKMVSALGRTSLESVIDEAVPASIRMTEPLALPPALSEVEVLDELRAIAAKNQPMVQMIGQGYYDTFTPAVIQRRVLENPGWYTAYTPYQPEISQGRLEALLNFQTMVEDLTGLPTANASLLDEATAAAEAMTMAVRASRGS